MELLKSYQTNSDQAKAQPLDLTIEISTKKQEDHPHSILKKYKSNRFTIPPLDFFKSISHDEFWTPEFITPWYYLDSYHNLEQKIRKRYNQLYALAINEIFTVLENEMLVPILKKMITRFNDDQAFQQCLKWFCEEEEKHSEMFETLNRLAEPEFYNNKQKDQYYLCRQASPRSFHVIRLMRDYPDFLTAWLWFTIYFEERTIVYSKSYLRKDQGAINSVFREVHKLHLLEEIYHVELDEVLVDRFYNKKNRLNRKFSALIFEQLLKSYAAPKRMSHSLGGILKVEFPQYSNKIQNCLNELPQLRNNYAYQEIYFGPTATPKTRKLMSRFPEFEKIISTYFV